MLISAIPVIVQFQKISILLPHKRLEFPGGGVSGGPKNLKRCMKCGGGRGVRKKPFDGGGMDIFWNFTFKPHWEFKAKMTKEK